MSSNLQGIPQIGENQFAKQHVAITSKITSKIESILTLLKQKKEWIIQKIFAHLYNEYSHSPLSYPDKILECIILGGDEDQNNEQPNEQPNEQINFMKATQEQIKKQIAELIETTPLGRTKPRKPRKRTTTFSCEFDIHNSINKSTSDALKVQCIAIRIKIVRLNGLFDRYENVIAEIRTPEIFYGSNLYENIKKIISKECNVLNEFAIKKRTNSDRSSRTVAVEKQTNEPDKESENNNQGPPASPSHQGQPYGCDPHVQEDAKKLVKSYIEVIIPLMKKDEKDEKDEKDKNILTRIQKENRGIYEKCHKGQTDMNGHLMDIHKDKIVQEYREQYILGYLATTNRQKAIDKIQRAGDAKWAKITASKEYTTDPAKIGSSKMTKENHDKKIEKLISDEKLPTRQKYYGYDYPIFGWNTLKNTEKFNRIVRFFENTFGYETGNATKQATTFSDAWHTTDKRPSPTTVTPNEQQLKIFVNVWGTGKMHETDTGGSMKIKGGRKTKKKRKKNASPSKTRKVKNKRNKVNEK